MLQAMDLEVAIIHHRTPEVLRSALTRLALHAPTVGVTVVDTAPDASVAASLASIHPHLRVLACDNHSYAHACNEALRTTTAPYVVLMNADVFIEARTLPDLMTAMCDPSVALSGPLAFTPAGRVQSLGLPYRVHELRLKLARQRLQRSAATAPARVRVPWLSGCMLMVRRTAAEQAGGMNRNYRFYNEDLEWGLRLRAHGWQLQWVDTPVVHVGGAATPASGRFLIEGLRGGYVVGAGRQPRWIRIMHRAGVALFALAAGATARSADARATWREVARRFIHGDFDSSPFGDTLAEGWPDAVSATASRGRPPASEER